MVLEIERLTIRGKTLVEPHMMKILAGYLIPGPLMGEFMSDDIFGVEVGGNGGQGLVFHSSAPTVVIMSVLFIHKWIKREII